MTEQQAKDESQQYPTDCPVDENGKHEWWADVDKGEAVCALCYATRPHYFDKNARIASGWLGQKYESQQRATESGCGAVVLWVGVFVAGVLVGYLAGLFTVLCELFRIIVSQGL